VDQERATLLDILGGPEALAAFEAKWGATRPAPDFVARADEACMEEANFCIFDGCEKWEIDRILVAALDAEPAGEAAVREAAVAMLRSIAVAGGWDDWLDISFD
jgi:hypothetical protein